MARIRLERLFPWETYANGAITSRVPSAEELRAFVETAKNRTEALREVEAYLANPLFFERQGRWTNEAGREPSRYRKKLSRGWRKKGFIPLYL